MNSSRGVTARKLFNLGNGHHVVIAADRVLECRRGGCELDRLLRRFAREKGIDKTAAEGITAANAVPTNADRVLGELAKVTETIDNENSTGAVYADGKEWTARSTDDTVIPAGSRVKIESMQGVKLLVRLAENKVEV